MRASLLTLTAIVLFSNALSSGPLFAQDLSPQNLAPLGQAPGQERDDDGIRAENCLVAYFRKVEIPAEALGRLKSIKIDEGDRTKAGDLIAEIDDTQSKLQVDAAKTKEEEKILEAANDVNLKDSVAAEKIAGAEANAYKELYEKKAIPYWEMQKKVLEAARAKLRILLAEMQMKIAKAQYFGSRAELRIAEDEVQRRKIVAPFDGFIESRLAELGQWVQPGSPIALLVKMDELKVEGDVDAYRYSGEFMKGTPVQVLIYHRGREKAPHVIESKITFVSSEIDLNNRSRIGVKIPNVAIGEDWLIKPGMKAEIIIKSGNAPAGRAPNQLY